MNELGGNPSSSSSNGGGGNNGINSGGVASDISTNSSASSSPDSKYCRDFIRNVCHRGKNCKFIHPENIKIRSDPIFCHDYQQNRCHRPTCKFIHCSREIEEHYKKTGELPNNVVESENGCQHSNGKRLPSPRSNDGVIAAAAGVRNIIKGMGRSNGNFHGGGEIYNSPPQSDIPICKDYLKGVCNRPPGSCKYRHVSPHHHVDGGRNNRNNIRGHCRRRCSDGLFELEPDLKKIRANENAAYNYGREELNEDFYVGNSIGSGSRGYSALPPPHSATSHTHPSPGHSHGHPTSVQEANFESILNENFMLKRRIEELKTSNEFLLNQNAQLRLSSSLSVSRNSVAVENVQVQPTVGVASVANGVVQTMITPSLSVAATQPLSSLSTISTLPTVSLPPVSISQALPVVSIAQHQAPQQTVSVYPMVTTQGVISQSANLT